jgi:menaquinone-specific isochorismate synthase
VTTTAAPLSREAPPLAPPRVRALAIGLERATAAGDDAITIVAVPSIAAPVAALADREDLVVAWEPRDQDEAWAGVGVAASIEAHGPRRFDDVARAAGAIFARVADAAGAPAARMFGGLAFAPGAADLPPWRGFGDARFTLPRWTYVRRGGLAWWLLAVDAAAARDHARWYLELAELDHALRVPVAAHTATVLERDDGDPAAWTRQVEDIRAEIASGRVAKVVAARPLAATLAAPAPIGAVLTRLGAAHPACTRYIFRSSGAAFVGATPERLVRRRGLAVDSEALAGSIARAEPDAAERLLASAKDRGEHDWVVRAVVDALGRFCARLDAPAEPRVRALRHILHLHTPIAGELAEPAHVLELAAALHPTPAVGGTPTADAVAWIAAHEPAPRGWYAAPVGWFDAQGDGELVVAIRSGLLEGRRAHVWAGAGIVRDSDAAAEWDEVALKQRALLGALGGT